MVSGLLLAGTPILPKALRVTGKVLAQDQTVYLSPGQTKKVEVYMPQMGAAWYDIHARKDGGGDMGGLRIYARARGVSAPYCEETTDLIIATTPSDTSDPVLNDLVRFYAHDEQWTEWIGGTIPSGYGYDYVEVTIFPRWSCPTSPASFEVEIRLEADETPTPMINFWADQDHITRGECVMLNWQVENVQAVYYQGEGVIGHDYRQECPEYTTTYELRIVTHEGEEYRHVTVYVDEPSAPPPTDTPYPTLPPTYTPWPTSPATYTPYPTSPATNTPYPTSPATNTPYPTSPATNTPWPTSPATNTPRPTSPATNTPWPTPTPRPTPTPPPCPDTFEPNDDSETTWQVSPGTYQSYICTPYDHDWFSVVLDETTDLQVTLTDLPADFQLQVRPQHGVPIKGSYNEGRTDEHVVFEDAGPGIYLIHVSAGPGDRPVEERGYSNEEPYTLIIQVSELPTPTPTPRASPPWVLVVTNSRRLNNQIGNGSWSTIEGWLQDRYGDIDVLDLDEVGVARRDSIDLEIETRVATYGGPPSFILIVGGPAVVAFGEANNPKFDTQGCASPDPKVQADSDCDVIYTDDFYGDLDHDGLPDVPTARLPDGGDLELYNVQFNGGFEGRTHTYWGSAMAIAMQARPGAADVANLIGAPVQWSPPVDVKTARTGGSNAYFLVHGADWDTSRWWGDDDEGNGPVAFSADRAAGSVGTIVSGACYGAYLGTLGSPISRADSIALQFLRNNSEAFIGHTASTYSIRGRLIIWNCIPFTDICWVGGVNDEWPVTEGPAYLEWSTFNYIRAGRHPLLAYHQAKLDLAASLGPEEYIRKVEEKALHSFVFYGLPPSR